MMYGLLMKQRFRFALLFSLLVHAALLGLRPPTPVVFSEPRELEVRLADPPGSPPSALAPPKAQPAIPAAPPARTRVAPVAQEVTRPSPAILTAPVATPSPTPPMPVNPSAQAEAAPAPALASAPPRPDKPASGDESTVIFDAAYLRNPAPDYPPQSRRLEEEGMVKLKVRVNQEGRAIAVEVAQSSGFRRLDTAAVEAVRNWRFVPARRDGQPLEATVIVPVRFTLND